MGETLKESDIQIQIVDYLKLLTCIVFFSVPNEAFAPKKGKLTGPQLGRMARFKRMGLRAGVSDLVICKNGMVYFMEVKNKKGRMSEKQKDFNNLAILANCKYCVVKSFDEALLQLRDWGI